MVDPTTRPSSDGLGTRYRERAERLRRALEVDDPDPATLRAYGDACRWAGRIAESEAAFARLLALATEASDRHLMLRAYVGQANALCARAEWDEAAAMLRDRVDDPGLGDPALRAHAKCVLASACFHRDALPEARELLTSAIRVAREYEDPAIETSALIGLGVTALAQGALDEAFSRLSTGLGLAERNEDLHWAAMARLYLSIQAHLAGRLDAAREGYRESRKELTALGLRRAIGLEALARAMLEIGEGAREAARTHLEDALSALSATCPDYESTIQAGLALVELAGGDLAAAGHRLTYARTLLEAGGPPEPRGVVIERVAAAVEGRPGPTGPIRSLEHGLLDAAAKHVETLREGPRLEREPDLHRFRVNGGEVMDISRRRPPRDLLRALVAHHRDRPGEFVAPERLIASVWPNERITQRAATNRLHTALSTLRKLGLADWIERDARGYRLRPELRLIVVNTLRT